MKILPPPYDKYVYDKDGNDLYSLKTKHFNKIQRYINSSNEYYWSVVVNSRYQNTVLTLSTINNLYEKGTDYKDKGDENYMLKVVKDNETKVFYYSLQSKLNADAMFYIKQGYTAKLYSLVGEYELIPEKIVLKK